MALPLEKLAKPTLIRRMEAKLSEMIKEAEKLPEAAVHDFKAMWDALKAKL